MGRRKITIAPITDDRNRSVTFLKRKGGLFKKAYELGVLCGADVAVVVFAANGKLYEFSSGDLNTTLVRYSTHDGPPHEHRGPNDFTARSKQRKTSASAAAHQDDDDDDDDDDDEEGLVGEAQVPPPPPPPPAMSSVASPSMAAASWPMLPQLFHPQPPPPAPPPFDPAAYGLPPSFASPFFNPYNPHARPPPPPPTTAQQFGPPGHQPYALAAAAAAAEAYWGLSHHQAAAAAAAAAAYPYSSLVPNTPWPMPPPPPPTVGPEAGRLSSSNADRMTRAASVPVTSASESTSFFAPIAPGWGTTDGSLGLGPPPNVAGQQPTTPLASISKGFRTNSHKRKSGTLRHDQVLVEGGEDDDNRPRSRAKVVENVKQEDQSLLAALQRSSSVPSTLSSHTLLSAATARPQHTTSTSLSSLPTPSSSAATNSSSTLSASTTTTDGFLSAFVAQLDAVTANHTNSLSSSTSGNLNRTSLEPISGVPEFEWPAS